MFILLTYDVSTISPAGPRRLRKIAQACKDYGTRVQKSVFECELSQQEWVTLRLRLLSQINPTEDSLRFYFLDKGSASRTEHHGTGKPIDLTDPLVF